MMKPEHKILVALILLFIAIRSVPAVKYELPTGYDVYFHMRVIEMYRSEFPAFDEYDCQGRWINYAPLFHLILAAIPLPAMLLVKFSSVILIALAAAGVFLLAREFFGTHTALLSSFFFLACKEIADASYGSGMPQAAGIFLLPFIAYFFLQHKKGKKKMLLYATVLLAMLSVTHTMSFFIAIAVISAYAALNRPERNDFLFLLSAIPLVLWLIYINSFSVFYPTVWGNAVGLWLVLERLSLLLPMAVIGALLLRNKTIIMLWFIIMLLFSFSWLAGINVMNIRALPFLAIPSAILAAYAVSRIPKPAVAAGIVILSLVPGIIYSSDATPLVKDKDEEAMQWINENLPENATFISPEEVSGMYLSYFIKRPLVLGAYAESCPDRYERTWQTRRFFLSKSCSVVEDIAKSYGVQYVYVNVLERNYYRRTYGITAFMFVNCSVERIYDNGFAEVYRIEYV